MENPKPVKRYINLYKDANGELKLDAMVNTVAKANANKRINGHLKFIRREVLEFKE